METSKLSDSFVRVCSDDDEFSIVEETKCGDDIGYSSDKLMESLRFHQLPGSTVCVSDDSISKVSTIKNEASNMTSSVESAAVKDLQESKTEVERMESHDESTIMTITRLREKTESLETQLAMNNRTLVNSLFQIESQRKAFDDLKKALEIELHHVREEAEQLKKENVKLFDRIEQYERSNDKNVLKSLTDSAMDIEAVKTDTENAKISKDENAKMNRSVERLRNDLDEKSLADHMNVIESLRSDNESKQQIIDDLRSKLDDVQSLTEQLAPVLDEVVKERKAKETALKLVKHLEEEQNKSMDKIENLKMENSQLHDVAESFVDLTVSGQLSQSVTDNFVQPSNVNEKYLCLQCWRHFKSMEQVKLHDGSCTSGFDAYF